MNIEKVFIKIHNTFTNNFDGDITVIKKDNHYKIQVMLNPDLFLSCDIHYDDALKELSDGIQIELSTSNNESSDVYIMNHRYEPSKHVTIESATLDFTKIITTLLTSKIRTKEKFHVFYTMYTLEFYSDNNEWKYFCGNSSNSRGHLFKDFFGKDEYKYL